MYRNNAISLIIRASAPRRLSKGIARILLCIFVALSCTIIACEPTSKSQSLSIHSVDIEKEVVRLDEDVSIRVDATDVQGKRADFIAIINGKIGDRQILRFDSPGKKEIRVTVKDPFDELQIQKKILELDVIDEPVEDHLKIVSSVNEEYPGVFDLEIVEPRNISPHAIYLWRFGDGSVELSRSPYMTHDYRSQDDIDSMATSYIVSVNAIMTGYGVLSGRTSVSTVNYSYWSSRIGSPTLPTIYERFAQIDKNHIRTTFKINNFYENTAELVQAKVFYSACSRSNERENVEPLILSASEILDVTSFEAKEITETHLTFNRSSVPNYACAMTIVFTGPWSNAQEISAKVNLDIPPTEQTPGSETMPTVNNQLLIEKLNRATEILGPNVPISPSTLRRLEKEGLL